MPELPEVETVCRGLSKKIKGETLRRITLHRGGLRRPFPASLKNLRNAVIKKIRRRAKYVLMDLDQQQTIILHLGMSGRLLIQEAGEKHVLQKHDHVVFDIADGMAVIFNDARRFGILDLADTANIEEHPLFRHLGPEPLDAKAFSGTYLFDRLKNKKTAVKIAIMDQEIVVGVGNIYASEALFLSKIDPRRAASSLSRAECNRLVDDIRVVLEKSITAGGSSLRDYVQTDGELGYFQHHFAVYGRDGENCTRAGCAASKKNARVIEKITHKNTGVIEKITQGGRSTYFCPRCQK